MAFNVFESMRMKPWIVFNKKVPDFGNTLFESHN